jgi:hypothetical protein
MYTSMMLALPLILAAPPEQGSPVWQSDYQEANQQGQNEKKPLAIFVGSGKKGYEKLVRHGKMNARIEKLLAEHYVCVYANTKKKAGKRLAKQFRLQKGLLISDRTGKILALRHTGPVASKALKRYLTKYADPNLEVKKTEKHGAKKRRPVAAPPPMMSFGGGGGC